MTISILAFDEETGTYGGAAATGSLCVGGWVLRGDSESGMSASQGSLPSTFWGSEVLRLMKGGASADAAVASVVEADAGRHERQLAALDPTGQTGGFTGAQSIAAAGTRKARHAIVAGNLLASEAVLDACLDGFLSGKGGLDSRLLQALHAAEAAGGDSRGLQSAALLLVASHRAPMTLRIDHAETPLDALADLHRRATTGLYADWLRHVPTPDDPERAIPFNP